MFTLPPHTTADPQPMDVGCFGPLKKHWHEICHDFIHENPGGVVNSFQFSTLFAKVWMRGMTPASIISGYKAYGIYLYNPDAILKQFEGLPSLPTPQSSLQESLSYTQSSVTSKSRCLKQGSCRVTISSRMKSISFGLRAITP